MEIALIVLALLSAGFLVAVWRLVRRADDPAASHAVVEEITRERDRLRNDVAQRNDELAHAETTIQERDKRIAAVEEDRVRERREAHETAAQLQTQLTEACAEAAGLDEAHEARTRELETIRKTLEERFKGAALAALKTSNDEFRKQAEARFRQERTQADERFQRQRELAAQDLEARRTAVDNLVKPLGENLTKLDRKVGELERARAGAYERVHEAVSQARQEVVQLRSETSRLHRALRSTRERGDWGEQQLRRVVEAAGMMEHVEFTEQAAIDTDGGRPDLIVTLPGDKRIVVDAKTPMDAYLDAFETEDVHQQQAHFRRHAEALTTRAKEPAQHNYTGGVPSAFDFAVMFVPHDAILDAAGELYGRLRVYGEHVGSVGKALQRAVESYNRSVGSLESRVLVQARRLEDLGTTGGERIAAIDPVELDVRPVATPELPPGDDDQETPDSMRSGQPSSLTSATVSPTMPAAMSHNCRYSRASRPPISARTVRMLVFSSNRTLSTPIRPSAISALSVVSTRSISALRVVSKRSTSALTSAMSDHSATSDAAMSALVATLPVMASPIVSTNASASGSPAPASQRAFTARWVSKASELMPSHCTAGRADSSMVETGVVWFESAVGRLPSPSAHLIPLAQSSFLSSLSMRYLELVEGSKGRRVVPHRRAMAAGKGSAAPGHNAAATRGSVKDPSVSRFPFTYVFTILTVCSM